MRRALFWIREQVMGQIGKVEWAGAAGPCTVIGVFCRFVFPNMHVRVSHVNSIRFSCHTSDLVAFYLG